MGKTEIIKSRGVYKSNISDPDYFIVKVQWAETASSDVILKDF